MHNETWRAGSLREMHYLLDALLRTFAIEIGASRRGVSILVALRGPL